MSRATSGPRAQIPDRCENHGTHLGRSQTRVRRKAYRAQRIRPHRENPPRWFVVLAWYVHRALYRVTFGRAGLWTPKDATHWGAMRLTTTGRRTGRARSVLLGYFEDGPNLVTLAMNGWSDGEPAWWLNLRERPDATVELKGGPRAVRGRIAEGDERARLWERWGERMDDLDAHAALRSTETAVVVLEPRT